MKDKEAIIVEHQCRSGCGACCIAPSISTSIPGMPDGKPARKRCIQLTDDLLCKLINSPLRPQVCKGFTFDPLICGNNRIEAIEIMEKLES
jgi:hypothetical protein